MLVDFATDASENGDSRYVSNNYLVSYLSYDTNEIFFNFLDN
jgi:hypothetical protein